MARKLTNQQKSMLDKLIEQYSKAFSWEEMPREEINKIASINDNELVWLQMNIYIQEQFFERTYG